MAVEIIRVGMADLHVVNRPCILLTVGLGSCVAIALFDKTRKTAGLAHIMLPDSRQVKGPLNPAKFADTAIDELLRRMTDLGADIRDIMAKLAGGACMFENGQGGRLNIGERNIECAVNRLKRCKIPIAAMDVGKDYGRTVEFNTATGVLTIKAVGRDIRKI